MAYEYKLKLKYNAAKLISLNYNYQRLKNHPNFNTKCIG